MSRPRRAVSEPGKLRGLHEHFCFLDAGSGIKFHGIRRDFVGVLLCLYDRKENSRNAGKGKEKIGTGSSAARYFSYFRARVRGFRFASARSFSSLCFVGMGAVSAPMRLTWVSIISYWMMRGWAGCMTPVVGSVAI